jgi:acyl carrier protein
MHELENITMQRVEQELRSFITDNFFFADRPISDTDSFLELGIIDSIGILQLISFVQQRYDIELDDRELIPEHLDSIRNLANLVRVKLRQSPASVCPTPAQGEV